MTKQLLVLAFAWSDHADLADRYPNSLLDLRWCGQPSRIIHIMDWVGTYPHKKWTDSGWRASGSFVYADVRVYC